ncbi:MAG: gluconate 2-dehydrogenase subunit 3 family protein [Alphaproteobacteria bacterium]|nr:gluconate 2-dehydrogenase subunit 3 family protein [Alphaproteobacteria bacterium]
MTDDGKLARRAFMRGAGVAAVAATTAATPSGAAETPPQRNQVAAQAPASAEPETWLALTPTEAAFVVAAVDTLIPADDLSPSGSDCGVAVFIDRQLASAWGGGDKMYRSGPYHPGTPEQGYQLPLTPRDYFTTGIAAANAWARKTYGKEFDRLSVADRTAALTAMETGKAEFVGFGARGFFERLLSLTMEGFFSDPIYGGNRDKVAWKMIGFPGLPATYANVIDDYHGKRFEAPPQSIADFS